MAVLTLLLGNQPGLCRDDGSGGRKPALAATTATSDAAPQLAPCISWRNPAVQPKFAILCVHGLGLYSKSYQQFGQIMSRFGGIIYAIDVRGFGSWMKAQGHENLDFNGCIEDIRSALKEIHNAHAGLPVFLLGESMGGAVALRAASTYPDLIDGVISAVPAGERFRQRRTDLKVAFDVLSGPHKERSGIGRQVVEQAATDKQAGKVNEQLAAAWQDDPLDRLDLSAKDLMQFQSFMNDNHDAVKKLTVPVLFLQGLDDDLVRPDGTWELMKDVAVHDRTLVALPARHLMLEESQTADQPVRRAAWHSVLAWVLSHLPEHAVAEAPPVRTISADTAKKITRGLPTVLVFYAKWCDQCDKIAGTVTRAQRQNARQVRFVKYDVDDPNNQDLLKELSVGAIPELIFLKPDGTISSSLMGESAPLVIMSNIADMLKQ
jgi:alpha-beta hydrolase superfamily lysophospholipase